MNVTFMSLGVGAAAGWRGTGDTGAWRLGADGARGEEAVGRTDSAGADAQPSHHIGHLLC